MVVDFLPLLVSPSIFANALEPLPPITPLLQPSAAATELELAISSALDGAKHDPEPMGQPSLRAFREARRSASGSFGSTLPKGCNQIDFRFDESTFESLRNKFLDGGGGGGEKGERKNFHVGARVGEGAGRRERKELGGVAGLFVTKESVGKLGGSRAGTDGEHDAWQHKADEIPGSEGEVCSSSKSSKEASDALNRNIIPTARSADWGASVGTRTRQATDRLMPSERKATEAFSMKRGRKRRNPGLTDGERKAIRQAQNRENAKQSRLRRINLIEEYRTNAEVLQEENKRLKVSIAALEDRLEFLHGIITVSVKAS